MDEIAHRVIKLYHQLREDRYNLEEHWREIARYFIPQDVREFDTLYHSNRFTKGEKRNFNYDSTPEVALGRFASILDSLLTPSHSRWQYPVALEDELMKVRRVALWFEHLGKVLFRHRYATGANFSSQNNKVYKSIGGYGTGVNFIDRHYRGEGLRYKCVHISQVYLKENHQGVVNGLIRVFTLTAEAAYEAWGEKLPKTILEKLKKNPVEESTFIHMVRENDRYDPERVDSDAMRFESVFVSEAAKATIEVGGFTSFPYAVSRYIQAEREPYGRSPAMEALSSAKTLNEEKRTVVKQGQRAVDPIYISHDNGIIDTWGARPGTINPGGVTADGRPLVHALPTGNIAVGDVLIQDERNTINDVFFVSLFQILTESPQMTATEVLERVREKGVLISPTIGRQESEYLGYMAEREIDLLIQQGLVDPMPPELLEAGGQYKMVYDTPMARARKAEEATGTMRSLEFALNMATTTGDMRWLDQFDPDKIMPMISKAQGMPESLMRSLEQIQEEREARDQAAQAQAEVASMPGQAALIKSSATAAKELGAAA